MTLSASGSEIPGYGFGSPVIAVSPVSMQDLQRLEQTVGWTRDDALVLQDHAEWFETLAEAMVDSWRSVISGQAHLSQWFAGPDGRPDDEYKARVRARFVQWVVDVATRPHDQAWLDYQEEIGLRHTPAKKNATDGGHTPPVVPLRYLLGFLPVVTEVGALLEGHGMCGEELTAHANAWRRAVHLHVTLWARAYVREGLW